MLTASNKQKKEQKECRIDKTISNKLKHSNKYQKLSFYFDTCFFVLPILQQNQQ